jgi:hypothetical protein
MSRRFSAQISSIHHSNPFCPTMSIFRKETSETRGRGEILRLGDAWKHVPGKPLDFDDLKPDESNDNSAPLLRLFNESRRAEYQGNITQTNVGSFACVHCQREVRLENGEIMQQSSRRAL